MGFKNTVRALLNRLPYVRGLFEERENYRKNALYPAGHYYSPIISVDEVRRNEAAIWKNEKLDGVPGIDLQTEQQISLLSKFAAYYQEIPFPKQPDSAYRFYFENDWYTYSDAILLYSVIRQYKPKQIIEVGSGFSSALMLDVNERFFNHTIQLTFIEPYTARLNSLLKPTDRSSATLIERPIQSVPLETFDKLNAGDILFIDSSHVSKTGSDVNYILFDILPRLKSGVLIHFHDVFYPFEYPKKWVYNGWNWNEDYLLRAFLMYNTAFEIRIFSHYLHLHHPDAYAALPLCRQEKGGCLWMEKK
jgi:predicted O-methyltransferase YrrM